MKIPAIQVSLSDNFKIFSLSIENSRKKRFILNTDNKLTQGAIFMLSSNNWKELINKQEPKKQRFTIKKLTVGGCFSTDRIHVYGCQCLSR